MNGRVLVAMWALSGCMPKATIQMLEPAEITLLTKCAPLP